MKRALTASSIALAAIFTPWLIQTLAAFALIGVLAVAAKTLLDRYPRKYLYWGLYLALLIVAPPFTVLATIVVGIAFALYFLMGVTLGDSRWVIQN